MKASNPLATSFFIAGLLVATSTLTTPARAKDKDKDKDKDKPVTATAQIQGCTDAGIMGTATLMERPSDEGVKEVRVMVKLRGLAPGKHAVHIHEHGACTPCSAAGGHFDPGPSSNPSPDGNHPFHMGDLINIEARDDGTAELNVTTTRITLSPGPLSLFDADGAAIIIHVNSDTYCPTTGEAGCAGGARAACGVIQLD